MKLGLMVAALCVPKPVSVLDAMGMDAICATGECPECGGSGRLDDGDDSDE